MDESIKSYWGVRLVQGQYFQPRCHLENFKFTEGKLQLQNIYFLFSLCFTSKNLHFFYLLMFKGNFVNDFNR